MSDFIPPECDGLGQDLTIELGELSQRYPRMTNYAGEVHRDRRLSSALQYYAGAMRLVYWELPTRIIGMHDHKGTLVVIWTHDPSPEDCAAMGRAWKMQNEDPAQVQHYALFTVAYRSHGGGDFDDVVSEHLMDYVNAVSILADYPAMVCNGG